MRLYPGNAFSNAWWVRDDMSLLVYGILFCVWLVLGQDNAPDIERLQPRTDSRDPVLQDALYESLAKQTLVQDQGFLYEATPAVGDIPR